MNEYPRRDYKQGIRWVSSGFVTIPPNSPDLDVLPWSPFDPTRAVAMILGAEHDAASAIKADFTLYGSFDSTGAGRWTMAQASSGTGTPTETAWGPVGLYAFAAGVFQYAGGGLKQSQAIAPTFIRIGAKNGDLVLAASARIWLVVAEIP